MSESVQIALIVALSSLAAPLLLAHLTNRNRAKEKRKDYARQDLVAKRAKEAADKVAAAARKAEEAARLLLESNKRVEQAAKSNARDTLEQLGIIHSLVNSDMTAALRAQLDALTGQAVQMVEIISLRQELGQQPATEALVSVESIQQQIAELRAVLSDRLRQTALAAEMAGLEQQHPKTS